MRLSLVHIYIIVFVAFIAGCGKKTPPPPPKVRSDLVLSLYSAMDSRRHDDALRKIIRLREIAPSDVFLANLETLEKNNSILMRAQKSIDDNELRKASECLSDGIVKYGRHPELMAAKKKLDVVNKITNILNVFKKPRDSQSLKRTARLLRKIATDYKPAAIYLPLASQELTRAAKLDVWEKKCAVDGLCSQIATLLKAKDQTSTNVDTLYAVLEVADPDCEVVKEYRDFISGKSDGALNVYNEEDIFDSLDPSVAKPKVKEDQIPNSSVKNEDTTNKESTEGKKDSEGWWKKFSF